MRYLRQNRWWQGLLLLFLLHQVLEKGLAVRFPFLDNYLDDLLCMPILLGALLGEQYDLLQRRQLSVLQIVLTTVVVILLFEFLLPGIDSSYTRDAWDVLCYALGSMGFWWGMNRVE